MSRYEYKGVIFDDVILKESEDLNDWSQVCKSCVNKHHFDHEDRLDDSIGSDYICGVEGCENEADYYIDFEDGELTEVFECTVCGRDCYNSKSPEVVFKDKDNCICENCSIDYQEVNGKVQLREEVASWVNGR